MLLSRNKKYGWMDIQQRDGQMADGHTDVQCETIMPCHYSVVGHKNLMFVNIHKL